MGKANRQDPFVLEPPRTVQSLSVRYLAMKSLVMLLPMLCPTCPIFGGRGMSTPAANVPFFRRLASSARISACTGSWTTLYGSGWSDLPAPRRSYRRTEYPASVAARTWLYSLSGPPNSQYRGSKQPPWVMICTTPLECPAGVQYLAAMTASRVISIGPEVHSTSGHVLQESNSVQLGLEGIERRLHHVVGKDRWTSNSVHRYAVLATVDSSIAEAARENACGIVDGGRAPADKSKRKIAAVA